MRLPSSILRSAALAMIAGLPALAACGKATPPTPPSPPATPASTIALDEIMNGIAASLANEATVLRRALRSWDDLGADDRRALAAALDARREWAEAFTEMIEANPTWTETVCTWYERVVAPPHLEVVGLRHRLTEEPVPGGERSRYARLLLDTLGSPEAARAQLTWTDDSPGSPENIHLLCVRFGHLDE